MKRLNAIDLIESLLYEGRKLLPIWHGSNADGKRSGGHPSFLRRAANFPTKIAKSAQNLEFNALTKQDNSLDSDNGFIKPSAQEREFATRLKSVPDVIKHHSFGLRYSSHPRMRRILDAVSLQGEDDLSIHPLVHREADRLHKHVIRRGIKAGILSKAYHPDGSGRKILVAGPYIDNYLNASNGVSSHDSDDHGTLGVDASQRGEKLTVHLRDIAKLVSKSDSTLPVDEKQKAIQDIRGHLALELDSMFRDVAKEERDFKRVF